MKKREYKKLTEKQIKEIKKLKKLGLGNWKIALKFKTSESTIRYHCNEEYRKRQIKSAIENKRKKNEKKQN